ncbi:MAG: rod shape-determining protein MreD [Alphaproteobacteria bacterium]|nr:rod shape-determining protein MreD [Alphaproteobacteria bacterium]
MTPLFGQFTRSLSLLTPLLAGLTLVIMSLLPLDLTGGWLIVPALPLMAIHYWGLVRPDLMPPLAVFFIGLSFDILSGGPVGLYAFVYLATYAVLLSQRRLILARLMHQPWVGFAITMGIACVIGWLAGSVVARQALSPAPFMVQCLVSVVVYPLIERVLHFLQLRIQRELG